MLAIRNGVSFRDTMLFVRAVSRKIEFVTYTRL